MFVSGGTEGEQEFCRLEAKNIQESLAQEAAFLEAENSSAGSV